MPTGQAASEVTTKTIFGRGYINNFGAGVIERWNRESREVLDQARVGLSYVHSPALYAVFSLCIFRASLREPVFFVCRLSAV